MNRFMLLDLCQILPVTEVEAILIHWLRIYFSIGADLSARNKALLLTLTSGTQLRKELDRQESKSS